MINKLITFTTVGVVSLLTGALADYHQKPVVGGVGYIGQTFFILNPEKAVGNQIIEITYEKNLTTPLLDHRLPDSILYSDNNKCYFSPTTRVANNVKDFQQRYADKFKVGGAMFSLVDSFNDEVRWAYEQMELFNRSISYSEIQCFLYNLQLNMATSGSAKLANWFIDEVRDLPDNIDGENLLAYYSFFEKYGDHVYTKCTVGGLINQFLATDYDYWKGKSISDIRELAERTFMVGVEASKKERFVIDPKFLEASTMRPYKYYGGAFPEFEDNWNQWSMSVLNKQNLICANWEAVPITEFLDLDHRVMIKKDTMLLALGLYLNKPACNHIKFSIDRPRLAIMKIQDVYNCDLARSGAWWLIAGADYNDQCLVSWAFLKGTGQRVIGQTQHLRTDINKERLCLQGRILRDSFNCSHRMDIAGNLTFIMKDPQDNLFYEIVDAREPFYKPHVFEFCPANFTTGSAEAHFEESFSKRAGFASYSIKNNCKTPYCTKLISNWTPYENRNLSSLAYVMIPRDLFDPIIDPDLIDFSYEDQKAQAPEEDEGFFAEKIQELLLERGRD